MIEEAQIAPEALDPRVRRTRQMLHEALEQLLAARNIEKISVGDIAEKATLNRATFYDHYSDKFALLDGLVASRFQELLSRRNVVFDGTCPSALRNVAHATCDYLIGMPSGGCPSQRQMEQHIESAIIAVVRAIILDGLRRHSSKAAIPPEMVAAAMAGAIYSAAREWVQTPDRAPVDDTVEIIFTLVHPMQPAAR